MGGREIKQVLYADDKVSIAEVREHLQNIVSKIESACNSMKLKIIVGKSKVLMVKKD